MNKTLVLLLLLLAVLAVGGAYYYFAGKDYPLRFSEQQLQEKLGAKLPLTKTYLMIFQVTLDHPRVRLVEGSSRVNAGLDVVLNIRAGNQAQPLGGSLDVSGGILYVPERGEFFLTDPRVERIDPQGLTEKYAGQLNGVLARALAEYFADHPCYRLNPADLKQAAAKRVLKQVVVENRELVVTLGL